MAAALARPIADDDLLDREAEISAATEADEAEAEAHELRFRQRQRLQFQRLKDEARALYGMVDGRPGVRSPAEWRKLLERAGDEIGNGRFIVRWATNGHLPARRPPPSLFSIPR